MVAEGEVASWYWMEDPGRITGHAAKDVYKNDVSDSWVKCKIVEYASYC